MKVLVTGASGFVGRALCTRIVREGRTVRGTVLASEAPASLVAGVAPAVVEPLGAATPWGHALADIDTIIHLAARVHVMRESSSNPLKAFRAVNTEGTECLARHAATAGIRRFVFMSTIGVHGSNSGNLPYAESDKPCPHNTYSVSKLEAENKLREIAAETGMEVVVIRAPLVYGPENPGNFLNLLKVVQRCLPLPLASISNKRSLLYVENLVDALLTCATHPAAAGKTFLVSDGEDISTPELIRKTAAALGVPARLFPFPMPLVRVVGTLSGKSAAVNRLIGSLMVDSSKIRQELGWTPPFMMEEGLQATAEWYLKTQRNAS
ncbi:NAD-dependent epimerase/dehydratase family protein [Geobacter sp. SVR]|uniref:NAD-dependent epimerase/dehydratase family protein n=1 Tax=Geobacter sp. SVR TaxID=2495594 RepID=UPI00143F022C|nr:NAD-dependent epimerase/dehydratase family protein [Geobacter sp. SVR]BCS51985.1 UDP-glucose 4-epimerase [Geobacter sp. SVR]GCF87200.1 UDP-glucose 4-epimerase [Geobacter sp. SVR]